MALSASEEEAVVDRLAEIDAAPKSFDSFPGWYMAHTRAAGKLCWTAALRLNGILGGGASVRFATPADVWEKDVYGHVEVAIPALGPRRLRLNPVEWRPPSDHSNPSWAPYPHDLATYQDRWHPFEINRSGGLRVFMQNVGGVALPLPDDISTFSEYLHFCAGIWKCPDIEKVPPPPWERRLV